MVEREQTPGTQFTGAMGGQGIVSSLQALPESYTERQIAASYWEPVGRDPYMEQQLVNAIIRRSVSLERPLAPVGAATQPGTR